MANNILTPEVCKSFQYKYSFLASSRQAILQGADDPAGKISIARLKVIERQRVNFSKIHGFDCL